MCVQGSLTGCRAFCRHIEQSESEGPGIERGYNLYKNVVKKFT